MFYTRPLPLCMPVPPHADAAGLEIALWNERHLTPTLDQQWLLRDHYQGIENTKRQRDWAYRFKILGPWR